jgi:hypothetical protein
MVRRYVPLLTPVLDYNLPHAETASAPNGHDA